MLVSAVSIMGSFLVSWSNAHYATQRAQISEEFSEKVNQIRESFVIEDVWFFSNVTGKYATITLRNNGDNAVKISNVYINNTQAWSGDKTISVGNTTSLTVRKDTIGIGTGKPQNIWVESNRDTAVKQVWRA